MNTEVNKEKLNVAFYENVEDDLLKFAVIIARKHGHWIFCKHRARETYEFPGGHRENGESIEEAAKRELYEETGALQFKIEPICVYSVAVIDDFEEKKTYGKLFFAEIETLEGELHSEIEKIIITDKIVNNWTYPEIQPKLFEEVKKRVVGC